jgi:hypothetical protein
VTEEHLAARGAHFVDPRGAAAAMTRAERTVTF